MDERVELLMRAVLIGVGATLVMDAWNLLLTRAGAPALDLALVGRWLGHLPEGRWAHESIARAAAIRGEAFIGWSAHYVVGITFSVLTLSVFGLDWARSPTLLPALVVGVATVAAPLLVLQPALGAGVASSRTPTPILRSLKSLATHTVYGVGLYLAAQVTAALLPAGQ